MGIFNHGTIENMPLDELEFAIYDYDDNCRRPTKDEIISQLKEQRTQLERDNSSLKARIVYLEDDIKCLENKIKYHPFIQYEEKMDKILSTLKRCGINIKGDGE